eukprot:4824197-Lingulodinium_polyedra.AAC.1
MPIFAPLKIVPKKGGRLNRQTEGDNLFRGGFSAGGSATDYSKPPQIRDSFEQDPLDGSFAVAHFPADVNH